MRSARKLGTLTLGLMAVLSLGGCGGDGGSSNTLTDAQAQELAGKVSGELGNLTAGLVGFDLSGSGMQGSLPAPAAATRLLAGLVALAPSAEHRQVFASQQFQAKCAPDVYSTTDSDADGVPDDARYTWNCTYSDTTGYGYSLTGSVRLRDVHHASTGYGYSVVFNQLKYTATGSSGPAGSSPTTSTEVNGSLLSDASAGSAAAIQDVEWRFTDNDIRTTRVSWDWKVIFTPNATIDFAAKDLPSGNFDVSGRFGYQGDAAQSPGDWSFDVSTVTPLYFNGSCDITPVFTSGAIKAAIPGHDDAGFYLIYTGCGQAPSIYSIDDVP